MYFGRFVWWSIRNLSRQKLTSKTFLNFNCSTSLSDVLRLEQGFTVNSNHSRASYVTTAPSSMELQTFICDAMRRWPHSAPLAIDVQNIIAVLLESKVPTEDIKSILPQVPILLSYPPSVWSETIAFLRNYQFHSSQYLKLLGDCPDLLNTERRKSLHNVLTMLRSMGFQEGSTQAIVLKNPALLFKSQKEILKNYTNLSEYFKMSDLTTLIRSNPVVLTDSWNQTRAKIDYVFEEMGLQPSDILKSFLFKHSLEKIKTRHLFLFRAGFYKKPDKKTVTNENQPLTKILDTSDVAFATIIAELTEEEYLAFADMMNFEINKEQSDSDDLSDDEFSGEGMDGDGD